MRRALRELLPGPGPTLLLRACLQGGAGGRAAWAEWGARNPDPMAGLAATSERIYLCGPLLGHAVEESGVEPGDDELGATLRAAGLREGRRAAVLHRGVGAALAALDAGGIDATVVGGVDFAERSWPRPGLRHTHDLDLLVGEGEIAAAAEILRGLGGAGPAAPSPRGDLQMTHLEGAPVFLHTGLFPFRGPTPPMGEILARRERAEIAGAETKVLAREDAIPRAVALGLCGPRPGHIKWVPDVHLALAAVPPDWERLVASAEASRLSIACEAGLSYLADECGLDVPAEHRARLTAAAERAGAAERDVIALASMRGRRHRRSVPHPATLPGTGIAVARRLPVYVCERLAGRR